MTPDSLDLPCMHGSAVQSGSSNRSTAHELKYCRYVGFWQTSVLSVTLQQQPAFQNKDNSQPVVSFLFGDESSARTQVDVPYNERSGCSCLAVACEMLLPLACCVQICTMIRCISKHG